MNLMEVDSQRFRDITSWELITHLIVSYLQTLWSGPFQIIVSIVMLWFQVEMGSIGWCVVEMGHIGRSCSHSCDDSIFTTSLQETGICSTRAHEGEGQANQCDNWDIRGNQTDQTPGLGTIILTTYFRNSMWWSECIASLCLLANALFFCLGCYSIFGVHYLICFFCHHGWSFNHFDCIHIQYSVLLIELIYS